MENEVTHLPWEILHTVPDLNLANSYAAAQNHHRLCAWLSLHWSHQQSHREVLPVQRPGVFAKSTFASKKRAAHVLAPKTKRTKGKQEGLTMEHFFAKK